MTKRMLLLALLLAGLTGCLRIERAVHQRLHGENPYAETPFWARYLTPNDPLDREIASKLRQLEQNPQSSALQNELGALLLRKGFPKDAEREFRRAVLNDPAFYPAWYNLGLVRESRGDDPGAMRALRETIGLKPGHAAAHFQLGLLLEKRGSTEAAVDHYARAYAINPALLDVRANPRVVDSKLVDRTLIAIYPTEHSKRSIRFQPTPASHGSPLPAEPPDAPSREPAATEILTPAPPVTEPAVQAPPPQIVPSRPQTAPPPPAQPPATSRFGAPARTGAPPPLPPPAEEEEEEEEDEMEEVEVPPPPPPPPRQ